MSQENLDNDIHEVFALAYASHGRKRAENYIFGDPHDEMTSITYYVWAIKGAHGTFIVDTGFDQAAAKERGRTILHPVGDSLKALGIEPAEVKNVIATHMHWDHAGNYDLFPNARYHIQDTELAYATGRCMCHQTLRIPFSESDVLAMVRKVFAYRVEFHDGVEELAPGIHRVMLRYGFMESPNLPKALGLCRKLGLKFDIMATSFFLGRRSIVPSANSGMPLWQDRIFIFLMKNAANPTDFFKIPPGRVVELGAQVTV